jgi:hypothetical protein
MKPQKSLVKSLRLPATKELDAFRMKGDAVSDLMIEDIMRQGAKEELYLFFSCKSWEDVQSLKLSNEGLASFIHIGNELPAWADERKMHEASALFRSNGNEFLFMLGIVSLPYCYAAAKGAVALYHTEKIRKNTERRLLDTTTFIIEIMKEEAFASDGGGFLAIKQVRLRHALARYYLQKIPAIQELGETPINQEDMSGTNLAFSYVALRAMPSIGVSIDSETQNAYLHFWSVVGAMLGLDSSLLAPDLKSAYHLERVISERHFYPSEEGRVLTDQLLTHYRQQIPNKMTTLLIRPLMRYLLGKRVSSIIGLDAGVVFNPIDQVMQLLPVFKRYIFPPVQSFDFISEQIDKRRKAMTDM